MVFINKFYLLSFVLKTKTMELENKNEVILNKMDVEESIEDISSNGTWTKKESVQVLWFFVIAFVLLLVFGYVVNKYLL